MFTIAAFGFTVKNGGSEMDVCCPVALYCLLTAAHIIAVFTPTVMLRKRPCPGYLGKGPTQDQ